MTQAGVLLRDWRNRRNLSQLELAHRAEVSPRHVSFIETGRARPTSAMILRLCDQLAVPLREQNRLLLAAGHAPAHPEHALADPPMAEANAAIDPILMEPPVNVIRLSLHERGLAPRIVNLGEWRAHLVQRLRREHDVSRDPRLHDLLAEVASGPDDASQTQTPGLVVPLQLRAGGTVLSFISTTTVFGTPREVTLSELAIEAFYPADDATRSALGV